MTSMPRMLLLLLLLAATAAARPQQTQNKLQTSGQTALPPAPRPASYRSTYEEYMAGLYQSLGLVRPPTPAEQSSQAEGRSNSAPPAKTNSGAAAGHEAEQRDDEHRSAEHTQIEHQGQRIVLQLLQELLVDSEPGVGAASLDVGAGAADVGSSGTEVPVLPLAPTLPVQAPTVKDGQQTDTQQTASPELAAEEIGVDSTDETESLPAGVADGSIPPMVRKAAPGAASLSKTLLPPPTVFLPPSTTPNTSSPVESTATINGRVDEVSPDAESTAGRSASPSKSNAEPEESRQSPDEHVTEPASGQSSTTKKSHKDSSDLARQLLREMRERMRLMIEKMLADRQKEQQGDAASQSQEPLDNSVDELDPSLHGLTTASDVENSKNWTMLISRFQL